MGNDNVVSLAAPAEVCDPLTELLRSGARRLIEAAVTAEFEEFLGRSRRRGWGTVGAGWYATATFQNDRY